MQVAQLAGVFSKYSQALIAAGEVGTAASLEEVARILAAAGQVTTQKFAASVPRLADDTHPGPKLDAIIAPFEALNQLLNAAGAKKQIVTDLELLLNIFRHNRALPISCLQSNRSVASASNQNLESGLTMMTKPELIESYIKKLESMLGSDGPFRATYNELAADKGMTKEDVIAIASRFFAPVPRNSSRPKALRSIMDRHDRLLDSRAASANIGSPKAA